MSLALGPELAFGGGRRRWLQNAASARKSFWAHQGCLWFSLSFAPMYCVYVCESRKQCIILFWLSQVRSNLTLALLRVLFLNTVLCGLLGGSLYLEKVPTSHTGHTELGSSKKAVAGDT